MTGSTYTIALDANGGVFPEASGRFAIPAKGALAVSFGLSLPADARLSFAESAAEVAQLTYVIEAAPWGWRGRDPLPAPVRSSLAEIARYERE